MHVKYVRSRYPAPIHHHKHIHLHSKKSIDRFVQSSNGSFGMSSVPRLPCSSCRNRPRLEELPAAGRLERFGRYIKRNWKRGLAFCANGLLFLASRVSLGFGFRIQHFPLFGTSGD